MPAGDACRPTLFSTAPLEVDSGETIDIPLADHVRAAGGGGRDHRGREGERRQRRRLAREGPATLVYTSAPGYFGEDAITFEVTDGTGPDDPEGRKATLTIPITVLPPDNQQPAFVDGQLDVAPGEDAAGLDLLRSRPIPTRGPRRDALQRDRRRGAVGHHRDDRRHDAAGDADRHTPKGTAGTLTVRITDGETEPVEGTRRRAGDGLHTPDADRERRHLAEAHQGETVRVPVLGNDFNPFPGHR